MANHCEFLLEMKNISKRFPGVLALDQAQLQIKAGEVHVLLGENGAGKSTLMKVLSGSYAMDEGEILLEGKPVKIAGIRDAQSLGINIIYQELNLLMHRTIAQNMFLGREPVRFRPTKHIDREQMNRESKRILDMLGLDFSPDTLVKDLSIAQRQMVEVAKVLSVDTRVLIMDEPTSSLTTKEIDALFEIVERLKKSGVSIIYISHRMEEIFRIGDRVTVMRDGKYIDTVNVSDTTMDDLVSMMVGRKISSMYCYTPAVCTGEALRTEKLTGLRFRNIDITVNKGEIVGLAGLVGAGRTELVKAIFGYDKILSGKVFINGEEMEKHSPKDSVEMGIGFLPEDRKNEGLVLQSSIKANTVQASLRKLFPKGIIKKQVEQDVAEEYRTQLRIATPDTLRPVVALSGGNQQKVVLGKWLCTGCKFFIFDEPTRGIDVGAKHEIYELISRLAGEGCGILVISSDQMELLGISDRIYVMTEGEIVAELPRAEATSEKVVAYAIGG